MTSTAEGPARPGLRAPTRPVAPPTGPVRLRWRGLPVALAVVVALVLVGLGAAYDATLGGGGRTGTALMLVGGCTLVAMLVRRPGLRAVVVLPPLAFVAVTVGAAVVQDGGVELRSQALQLATALLVGAPELLLATAGAAIVAVTRLVAARLRG